MFRSILFSVAVMGICVGLATAADKPANKPAKKGEKKAKEAQITKVDAKKGTVTVKMTIKGKEVEKTFKLADNIEYADSTGKVASIDIFTSGDLVLMVEAEGQVKKLKKCDKPTTDKKPKKNK